MTPQCTWRGCKAGCMSAEHMLRTHTSKHGDTAAKGSAMVIWVLYQTRRMCNMCLQAGVTQAPLRHGMLRYLHVPFRQRLQDQGQYLRVAFVHKKGGQASLAVPISGRPRLLLLLIGHENARQEKGRLSIVELSDAFDARRQKHDTYDLKRPMRLHALRACSCCCCRMSARQGETGASTAPSSCSTVAIGAGAAPTQRRRRLRRARHIMSCRRDGAAAHGEEGWGH
jgi:hypothetical protein